MIYDFQGCQLVFGVNALWDHTRAPKIIKNQPVITHLSEHLNFSFAINPRDVIKNIYMKTIVWTQSMKYYLSKKAHFTIMTSASLFTRHHQLLLFRQGSFTRR